MLAETNAADETYCKEPVITLIVLNWNNAADTLECLHSLKHIKTCYRVDVVVVDNGSTDGSVAEIRSCYPRVTILEMGENLGYAGGNNAGIHHALSHGANFVCILNNDVTVESDFLGPLLDTLQRQPDVGVATPLVAQETGNDCCVWALGCAMNRRTAEVTRRHAGESILAWRERASFEVEAASGAAMLVRREVFERVGLLDEAFFLYYEEVDWSLRVRQAGYRILAVPSSVVWHKVSSTLGKASPVIDYYMLRNHLRLIGRHWSGGRRYYLTSRVILRNLLSIAAFTVKPHGGRRIPNRDARLLALRDALLGRWGPMGADVARICHPAQ